MGEGNKLNRRVDDGEGSLGFLSLWGLVTYETLPGLRGRDEHNTCLSTIRCSG